MKKLKRLLIISLTTAMLMSNFHAMTPEQELTVISVKVRAGNGDAETAYKLITMRKDRFPIEVLETEIFNKGFMLDYIDRMKADGILPADYTYNGKGSSAQKPA